MKCPVCKDIDLIMTERKGVEIDYCPQCRGVWLDRGELDKIIERSAEYSTPSASPASAYRPDAEKRGQIRSEHQRGNNPQNSRPNSKNKQKRGKKNRVFDMLEDIFDF